MHIPPYNNHNKAVIDADDERVPLNYFNIVKLKRGEHFHIPFRNTRRRLFRQRVPSMSILKAYPFQTR